MSAQRKWSSAQKPKRIREQRSDAEGPVDGRRSLLLKSGTGGTMQAAAAKLSRIAPELPAAGLEGAIDYYVRALGFELAMQLEMSGYAIVERDGVAIHLFQADGASHTPMAVHIFTLELDELHAEFAARGAQITQPIERKPWGNREFRVRDSFCNLLKFTEPAGF
jgi:uncharacterized glyoxalase superfamily protein PhnB